MPQFVMPRYDNSASQNIMNVTQALMNLTGNIDNAVKEYKAKRSLQTASQETHKFIMGNRDIYGLDDEQTEAVAQQLKPREGEKLKDYENRISPTLANFYIYGHMKRSDPKMDIDLPNPFMDNRTFLTLIDDTMKKQQNQQLEEQKLARQENVESSLRSVTGTEQKEPLQPGQSLGMQMGEQPQQPPVAKTQEEAMQMMAGRVGGQLPRKELEQYPQFASLPTRSGMAKEQRAVSGEERDVEMHGARLASQRALTTQRQTQTQKTRAEIEKLKKDPNKRTAVNAIKDYASIARLDLQTKEMLQNIPKTDENGEISDDYIETKLLSEELSKRRKIIEKELPQPQKEEPMPYSPRHEEGRLRQAQEGTGIVGRQAPQTPEVQTPPTPPMPEGGNEEVQIQRLSQQYDILPNNIRVARQTVNPQTGQPYTFEEIVAELEGGQSGQ